MINNYLIATDVKNVIELTTYWVCYALFLNA